MKAADIENILFSDVNMKNTKLRSDREKYIKHLFSVYGYKFDSDIINLEAFNDIVKHKRKIPNPVVPIVNETKKVKKHDIKGNERNLEVKKSINGSFEAEEIYESGSESKD